MSDKQPNPYAWTDAEKDTLRRMVAENATVDEVMIEIPGRTPVAMAKMIKKLGLPGATRFENYRGQRSMTVLGAQKLARKMQNHPNFKDYMRRVFGPNADYRERKCLTCGKMFLSWGAGNRLCDEHRKDANDSYAVMLDKFR